jgi:hypothetical protein
MATLLDYLDAPAAAPAAPTKSKQPSAQEMYGVKDLQDSLSQIQSTLPDYVLGSPSHKRALSDIQSIQSELQRHAAAPKVGTLSDFLDAPVSPDLSGPGSITPQGHLTPQQMEANVKPVQPSLAAQALQRAFQLKQRVPGEIASALDVVGNIPSQIAGTVGYGAGRLFGLNPQEATAAAAPVSQALANPAGRLMGVTDQPGYQSSAPAMAQQAIGGVVQKGAEAVGQRTGINPTDIEQGVSAAMMAMPFAKAPLGKAASAIKSALPEYTVERVGTTPSMGSAGAAAVPDATTIKAALANASPELKQAVSNIPIDKINIPILQRHIEADSLKVPVLLTEGQASGDPVKLSKEQNMRGANPELAARFNEQNGQLIQNIDAIRDTAAPDAYGTKTIENSDGLINGYKQLDDTLNKDINAKYKAVNDANGFKFPVDAPALLDNINNVLHKEGLYYDAPVNQMNRLKEMADSNSMNMEGYLSVRKRLSNISATAENGETRYAAKLMMQELDNFPLQNGAEKVKPLVDVARAAARNRFQMLDKDPAFNAAVNDTVAPDNFVQKFVINGKRDDVQAMIDHLGRDSVSHQHMAGGTLNWLREKAVDGSGNFSQAAFNKAIAQLENNQKLNLVFNPDASSSLKTLGNVAHYTQAQPKGSFVNNSNTLVGALAQRASQGISLAAQKGLDVAVPGLQLGTSIMEMRARRAARKAAEKSLEPAAGVTSLKDIGK